MNAPSFPGLAGRSVTIEFTHVPIETFMVLGGFTPDEALGFVLRRVKADIDRQAAAAVERIDRMYAVGTGVCHCGLEVEDHSGYSDNHAPVEMFRDKAYAA